jgi:hypothetical protein
MGDIMHAIEEIMQDPEIPRRIAFHCGRTALAALKSQGFYTDVDLSDFFAAVYAALTDLVIAPRASSREEDTPTVALEALGLLLTEQRNVPLDRLAAFVKRIATTGLLHLPPHAAAGCLVTIAALIQRYPRLSNLMAGEQGVGAAGTYMPELDEPDHCNAWATSLWELAALQISPHYHPQLAKLAAQFLGGSDPKLLKVRSAHELALALKKDAVWSGVPDPKENEASALKIPGKRAIRSEPSDWFIEGARQAREAVAQEKPFGLFFHDLAVHRRSVVLQRQRHRITAIISRYQQLKKKK